MKDFIEFALIWITHIICLFILFVITSIGLGVLKNIGLSYENTVCTVYGYICGMVCNRIIWRNKNG